MLHDQEPDQGPETFRYLLLLICGRRISAALRCQSNMSINFISPKAPRFGGCKYNTLFTYPQNFLQSFFPFLQFRAPAQPSTKNPRGAVAFRGCKYSTFKNYMANILKGFLKFFYTTQNSRNLHHLKFIRPF